MARLWMSAAIHLLHLVTLLCGQGTLHVSQKTDFISITKVSYLILCMDVIGIYVSPTKHICLITLYQDAEFNNIAVGDACSYQRT